MKKLKLASFLLSLLLCAGCVKETVPAPADPEPVPEETQIETAVTEAPVYSGPRVIVDGRQADRELTAAEMETYPQATNLPTLYIDLGKAKLSSIQHGVCQLLTTVQSRCPRNWAYLK